MRLIPLLFAGFLLLAGALAAAAQGLFSPVLTVNGRPVSGFELEQRKLFLQVIRAPGDLDAQAETALIEDRLRQDAAKRAGIKLTAEQVKAGLDEFAGRANLTTEQFLAAIAQGGVQPETFRDFVSAGLVWREVVRAKFAGGVRISEAEIDRALTLTSQRGAGVRVLLSELVIPGSGGNLLAARDKAVALAAEIRSEADFARAARANSAAPSRDAGGKLGWIPLSNLPASVRPLILQLRPGQITPPIPVGNGIALFQLRALDQGGDIKASNITVDYAQFLLAGGPEEGARLRGQVDTCDDLYPISRKLPADRLQRQTAAQTALPADIARELAALDEGEASTALTRGGATIFLMLCKRTATVAEGSLPGTLPVAAPTETQDGKPAPRISDELGFGAGPSREQVRQELLNQRLGGLADGYLEELKADAVITRP